MRRMMHFDIPTYPFVASVRLRSRGTTPQRTRANTLHSEWSEAGSVTPGSFPPSPESRAHIMSRGFDRTDNIVFRARDKLRMEALASDSDAGIRRAASKLLLGGKFGTFDQQNSSQHLKLSYGFHCASRLATGPEGPSPPAAVSTRASLCIRRDVYVYVEYFVRVIRNSPLQASSASASPVDGESSSADKTACCGDETKSALFSIGLATAEGNLDAEVGTYDASLGLSSTGYLSVCSGPAEDETSTFQLQSSVSSGDRLGMLLFLPSPSTRSASPFPPQQQAAPVEVPAVGEIAGRVCAGPAVSTETVSDHGGSEESCCSDESSSLGHPDVDGQCMLSICFNVNGCVIPLPMLAQYEISDMPWGSEEVHPTLSLHADNIAVWAGFSVDDVKFRSREHIGAPPGEMIYCLDGSVLIDASV